MISLALTQHDQLNCAVVLHENRVTDLYIHNPQNPHLVTALVSGKVTRLLTGGRTGFVKFLDQEGYVPRLHNVKTGDLLLLSVLSAKTADKAPEMSMDVRLPGRFLIFLPHSSGIQFSKRLAPEQIVALQAPLQQLSNVGRGGWIVRSAAAHAKTTVILHEAAYLVAQERLLPQKAEKPKDDLVLPPLTPLQQAIINHGAEVDEIILPKGPAELEWLEKFAPDLSSKIKTGSLPAAVDLDAVLLHISRDRVTVGTGAWIQIERTKALTVIDVNGGEVTNHFQTNLQAVEVAAHELRLRNIGGMVVIDTIRLYEREQKEEVLQKLRQSSAHDPAGLEILGYSRMGLIECIRHARSPAVMDVVRKV